MPLCFPWSWSISPNELNRTEFYGNICSTHLSAQQKWTEPFETKLAECFPVQFSTVQNRWVECSKDQLSLEQDWSLKLESFPLFVTMRLRRVVWHPQFHMVSLMVPVFDLHMVPPMVPMFDPHGSHVLKTMLIGYNQQWFWLRRLLGPSISSHVYAFLSLCLAPCCWVPAKLLYLFFKANIKHNTNNWITITKLVLPVILININKTKKFLHPRN